MVTDAKAPIFKNHFWHFQIKIKFEKKLHGKAVSYYQMLISSGLFLDTCLVFHSKNVKDIKRQLNKVFTNICDWFVDNKLSINFGEDKIWGVKG